MSLQKLIEKIRTRDMSLDDYEVQVDRLCKAAEVMRERLDQFCGCDLTHECICCYCKTVLEADQICAEGE